MGILREIQNLQQMTESNTFRWHERIVMRAFQAYYRAKYLWSLARGAKDEPAAKVLRRPVNRLVEFYVAHLWPGALPDALPLTFPDGAKHRDAIEKCIMAIWEWSNFGRTKQWAARQFALTGWLYIKIGAESSAAGAGFDRVFLQILDPATVRDVEVDNRGIVQYCRIDLPQTYRARDKDPEAYTYTEIWDTQGVRRWEHKQGESATLQALGKPSMPFTQKQLVEGEEVDAEISLEDWGSPGFIPIVRAPFREINDEESDNCFAQALAKIDEADAIASRLHKALFRFGSSVLWAIERAEYDPSTGQLAGPATLTDAAGNAISGGNKLTLSNEDFLQIPGTLKCLVPPIDFAAALSILNAHLDEIKADLPELLYSDIMYKNQLATETVRMMLQAAFDRAAEARGNAESALIQAHKMALTIGQNKEVPQFGANEIGTWEAGDFEHSIDSREFMPLTKTEEAALKKVEAETDQIRIANGIPLHIVLQERGYSDEEIEQIESAAVDQKAKGQTAAEAWLAMANRADTSETEEVEQ